MPAYVLLHSLLAVRWLPSPVHPPCGLHDRALCRASAPQRSPTLSANAVTASRYGIDPRSGCEPGSIEPNDSWAAESISAGEVGVIDNVNKLQAAIDSAAASEARFVVVKFERHDCIACGQTRQLYVDAAKEFGPTGLFLSVDCMVAKPFAKDLAQVQVIPSALVFVDGELQTSMRLARRDWRTFYGLICGLSPARGPRRLFKRAWRRLWVRLSLPKS